jgi:sporulation protein YlmC with PRC-barrel domain
LSKKRKSFKEDSPNQNQGVKMEKTDKPLTRDALVSMQVIDAKGRLVGKVKDVSFEVGRLGISLAVEKEDGGLQNVLWDEIQAASDFIILKPQPQAQAIQQQQQQPQTQQPYQPVPKQQPTQPLCSTCSKPLTWIPQYNRWYCYNEKKYV